MEENLWGGQDKSKQSTYQSEIPRERFLGQAKRGRARGKCQAGDDITAAMAVYLCGDQAVA